MICDEIYSYAASNNERNITKNIVDVARDKYTIYQSYFHVLWSLLRTNVSKLILVIILRESLNEELVQLDTILNKINYYGLNIIKSKIHSDHIKELMDYDLIKFEREVYKPSMPLMGKWFTIPGQF